MQHVDANKKYHHHHHHHHHHQCLKSFSGKCQNMIYIYIYTKLHLFESCIRNNFHSLRLHSEDWQGICLPANIKIYRWKLLMLSLFPWKTCSKPNLAASIYIYRDSPGRFLLRKNNSKNWWLRNVEKITFPLNTFHTLGYDLPCLTQSHMLGSTGIIMKSPGTGPSCLKNDTNIWNNQTNVTVHSRHPKHAVAELQAKLVVAPYEYKGHQRTVFTRNFGQQPRFTWLLLFSHHLKIV